MFPYPDMATHDRLYGIATSRPDEVGETSAEILSAVFCFLLGTVGPMKTAEIMRDWAGHAQRKAMQAAPVTNGTCGCGNTESASDC